MVNETPYIQMLDLIAAPCFCVREGQILACNPGAKGLFLTPGTPVEALLATGQQEYAQFSGGCLSLTLTLEGTVFRASVERKGDADFFLLEEPLCEQELQALSLAARDLRTPLGNLLSSAEALRRQASELPEAQAQLNSLNRSLAQMQRIIGNMSASYSSTRQQELLDITGFYREVFEKAAALLVDIPLKLIYTGPSNAIYTTAYPQELERAALNLVSNAAKFSPKGSTVQVSLTRQDRMLRLVVTDAGCGVPPENRGTLFRRYLRAPSIEELRQGIGLGMVLVRNTAAHHGGTVLVDFPPQGGTRVCMTLAIRQDVPAGLRSPLLRVDYAGERDHALIELADVLPAECYRDF